MCWGYKFPGSLDWGGGGPKCFMIWLDPVLAVYLLKKKPLVNNGDPLILLNCQYQILQANLLDNLYLPFDSDLFLWHWPTYTTVKGCLSELYALIKQFGLLDIDLLSWPI